MAKGTDGYILNFQKAEEEDARLDAQHEVVKYGMMNGRLIHPLVPTRGILSSTIADVGCGTGVWLNDMARTFFVDKKDDGPPTLIGFDIDASRFTSNRMLGVELIEHDCTKAFDPKYHGKFDIVNIRLLAHAVPEEGLLRILWNSCQLLRKGGHLQWLDSDINNWGLTGDLCEFPRILQTIQAERLTRRYVPDISHFMLSELLGMRLPVSDGKDVDTMRIVYFHMMPGGALLEDGKQFSDWDRKVSKTSMKVVQLFLQASILRKEDQLSSCSIRSDGEGTSQEIANLKQYEALISQALSGDSHQIGCRVPLVVARRGWDDQVNTV